MHSGPSELGVIRFELLPFDSAESAASRVGRSLTLTVTCSPRHGNDHTIDAARRLRARGHTVVVHLAARMVRGPDHLDELLSRMAGAGLDHVFVEAFGTERVARLTLEEVQSRVSELHRMTQFTHPAVQENLV